MKSLTIFLLALISLTNAVTFSCVFMMKSDLNIESVYTCIAEVSNFNETDQLTEVTGRHQIGQSNDDVLRLWIVGERILTFFPKGIENFFQNLIAINFQDSGIRNVIGDEFRHFPNLIRLNMNSNTLLQRIPGNLFEYNPLLIHVDFNGCAIQNVGENLFDGIADLVYLDFRNNVCISQFATDTAGIRSLIANLRTACPDDQTTTPTTTTTVSSTTSTEGPSCGDANEVICQLKEQNEILMEQNAELKEEINAANEKIDEMQEELSEMKKIMNEVLEGIIELSTRPCGR